jgi:threonine/homoserine/homoserine lactone efflux protein
LSLGGTVIALSTLLTFMVTCAIIEVTPGPNMAYLAALSLSRGWRTGLAAVAGVAIGLSVYGVAGARGHAAGIE